MTIEEINRKYGSYEGNILKKCDTKHVGELYVPSSEPCDVWYDWQSYIRELMLMYLNPDTQFLDAGANFGYFSLVAASIINDGGGCIRAIEPNPFVFAVLCENAALHNLDDFCAINMALSDGTRNELDFYWRNGANGNGRSYDPSAYDTNLWMTHTVKAASLDFFDGCGIDVIKMDIEGAEFDVLQHSEQFFAHNKEVVIILEQHPPYMLEQYGNEAYERYKTYIEEKFKLINGSRRLVSVLQPK